jgi:hypothetical protein
MSIVGAVFTCLLAVPFLLGEVAGVAFLSVAVSLPAAGCLILVVIENALFWHLLKAPTAHGRRVMDALDGFRLYLSVGEAERLNIVNPPERTPELFERYLPYALALDVENDWAAQFTDILARATAEGYSPAWSVGQSGQRVFLGHQFLGHGPRLSLGQRRRREFRRRRRRRRRRRLVASTPDAAAPRLGGSRRAMSGRQRSGRRVSAWAAMSATPPPAPETLARRQRLLDHCTVLSPMLRSANSPGCMVATGTIPDLPAAPTGASGRCFREVMAAPAFPLDSAAIHARYGIACGCRVSLGSGEMPRARTLHTTPNHQ